MLIFVDVAFLLAGLGLGVLAGWLLGSARLTAAEHALTAAQAQMAEKERAQAEKLKEYEQARERMNDSFKALAADALNANNQAFLDLAKTAFGSAQKETSGELAQHKTAVEALVQPIKDSLEKVDHHITEMEKDRAGAYAGLLTQVRNLGESQQQLQTETARLVRALRAPQTRGRWGEITLRRVVEMAGMTEHCDFDEQVSVDAEGGRVRPDLIVRLPGGRVLVVDAKVSLQAYLDSLDAPDDITRGLCLTDHARQVRDHVTKLGGKNYFEEFEKTLDFVIAFVPGDTFLGAAFEKDAELFEYAIARKVLITTPTTLIALLRAVAYGWRQEAVEENAIKIRDLGKELYERIAVLAGHFKGVGEALDKTVKTYNDAVGALESRVLVTTRRFRDLQVETAREVEPPEVVDRTVRELQAPELARDGEGDSEL